MSDAPPNEALQRAVRLGIGGVLFICVGIVWVFVNPAGGFGGAEACTLIGMLMILTAVWKAAEAAGAADDDER